MEHKCGFATIHRSATFCFEPGGDSPYRKGFYDAMLAGCIPVIFSLQNELVAPWFVPKGVAVRLSESAYTNGTFKALDVLRSIAPEEIRRRQSILREHGHRLQYAVDDTGDEPDAVETLFVGALGLAHDLEALYDARGRAQRAQRRRLGPGVSEERLGGSRVRDPLPSRIYWLHIPKCGSSFANTVVHWACDDVALNKSVSAFLGATPTMIVGEKCPRLHKNHSKHWGRHKDLNRDLVAELTENAAVVTMLREPHARAESAWNHHHTKGGGRNIKFTGASSMDAEQFANATSGCLARTLTGHGTCLHSGPEAKPLLDAALARLRGLAFVGIVERWAESICLFHMQFGGKCLDVEFEHLRSPVWKSTSASGAHPTILH